MVIFNDFEKGESLAIELPDALKGREKIFSGLVFLDLANAMIRQSIISGESNEGLAIVSDDTRPVSVPNQ